MSQIICPDGEAIARQAIPLLPRGRAWQTDEGGPSESSVLYRFWRAVGETFGFISARLCALRQEFWCATHIETHDLWMAEYGLPDPDGCDPFPDLCAKVAAQGGARCDDYRRIAAEAGWDIDCYEEYNVCGAVADCVYMDNLEAVAGGTNGAATLFIRIYRDTSPSYAGPLRGGAYADCFVADGFLDCGPDITGLICLLDRIVHAHVAVEYVLGDPRTTLTDSNLTADSGVNVTGEYNG